MNNFILCFHSFDQNTESIYDFSLNKFNNIINILTDFGYTFVSRFEDLSSNNIYITIDDGSISTIDVCEKILFPREIYPLLAIPANSKELGEKQIQDLHNKCVIASHGFDHIRLIPENESFFEQEINVSKSILENILSSSITDFVYPTGRYCDKAINMIKKIYKKAYTVDSGSITSEINPFLIPRYMFTRHNYRKILLTLKEAIQ